jgi:hypothetical protein
MIGFNIFHPSLGKLLAIAGQPRGEVAGATVHRHLKRCNRCQRIVADVQVVEQAASQLRFPNFDEGRVWTFIERRQSLSLTNGNDMSRRRGARRLAVPAFATALAVLVILTVVTREPSPLGASATAGILSFTPIAPRQGAQIAVRYAAREDLRNHTRLVLRARLRSARDAEFNAAVPTVVVATLTRQRSGDFIGTFTLADSIVYGAFAAEAADASSVDANNGAPWELLIHEADGRPALDALEQRAQDLLRRDWEAAAETARRQTDLYPLDPLGWQQRWSFESRVATDSARDSLRATVTRVFNDLDRRYADSARLAGRVLYGMHALAITASARDRVRYWRSRLAETSADSTSWATDPWLVRARSIELNSGGGVRDARSEVEHERLFAASRTRDPLVISQARVAAYARGDGPAVVKWTARAIDLAPELALPLLADLHEFPDARHEALALIERTRATFAASGRRPLEVTNAEMRVPRERAERLAFAASGRIHLAAGDTALAQAMFLKSGETGWDPELFRTLAELLRASGSSSATTFGALVAVDPAASAGFVDSARARYAPRVGPQDWQHLLARAEQEMFRRVADDESPGRFVADAWLRRAGSEESVSLAELTGDAVTFVAYWSRNCGPSLASLTALDSTARRLRLLGVRVITLSKQPSSVGTQGFLRTKGYTFPVYFESIREGRLTHIDLRMTGTPSFAFVDRHGRLRHPAHRLEQTLAQAKALLAER